MPAPSPFVLLDDARTAGASPARLYADPVEVVTATDADEVREALERVRAGVAGGRHAAGYLAYAAGAGLAAAWDLFERSPNFVMPDLFRHLPSGQPEGSGSAARWTPEQVRGDDRSKRPCPEAPRLWFGLFDTCRTLAPEDVPAWLPDPAAACAGPPVPLIGGAAHAAALARAQALIAAGDIYQVNLTFPCRVPVHGDPRALYARLRARAAAGWGALVFTGNHWLISCSPELFFTLDPDRRITARPMKGTAPPDADPATLTADPKQRAENLMIVDLLRNDLSRVAVAGSVAVPRLFDVERYPTVMQMTSTVTATLAPGRDAIDLIAAAFPCGSITGAPKLRAMEVIADLEPHARGVYTGSIGSTAPDGSAAFNVAIRTLELADGAEQAVLGLGSGIVADSQAGAEWRECLAKSAFMSAALPAFDLIETMAFDPAAGVIELDRHMARLKASADALGFAFDRHDARNDLQAATFHLRAPMRLRLLLSRTGAVAIEATPPPPTPDAPVTVAVVPLPVDPSDIRLRHKTSDRAFYDDARTAAGTFEVIFADPAGFLTEGSFTSLFVERDGRLLTPPLSRSLLPGVLRARLIDEGAAVEADLRPADLAHGFLIGNALRGLIPARTA